jgi:hypothetical protein
MQAKRIVKKNFVKTRWFPIKVAFIALTLTLLNSSVTHAELKLFEWSSTTDTYNQAGVDQNYDLINLSISIFDTDPTRIYFFLNFKNRPWSSIFSRSGGRDPWGAVLLYWNQPSNLGGNRDNFRIWASNVTIPENNTSVKIDAAIPNSDGSTQVDFSKCNPRAHMNTSVLTNTWVGFSIEKDCAQIPNQFYVVGYVDPDSNAPNDFDYAPNQAELVNLNNLSRTPTPTPKPTPIIQVGQNIQFETPEPVKVGDQGVLIASSDSGLPLGVESQTPEICDIVSSDREEGAYYFDTYKAGNCKIIISQDGNVNYFPATSQTVFLKVLPIKKATPAPVQKRISGNASTSAKPSAVPSSKATTSSKIGGSSKVTTKPSPSSTKK